MYTCYSSKLSWTECFKLIRKLVYKIERAQRKAIDYSGEKYDIEMEKTITKCLCKVLEGLCMNENIALPDAVQIIEQKAEKVRLNSKKKVNEFSSLLESLVKEANEKVFPDDADDQKQEEVDSD